MGGEGIGKARRKRRLLRLRVAATVLLLLPPTLANATMADLVEQILSNHPDWFGAVLGRIDHHQVQILYTQIDRDVENRPIFTSHAYRVDPHVYFYPASAVKLPAALLALEKLNRLRIDGLDRNTPLRFDSAAPGRISTERDETAPDGLPTIGHYIRKLFLVSDNDAFDRLYDFLGQPALNESLWSRGYGQVRLTHRLALPRTEAQNACANPVTFYDGRTGRTLYEQPLTCSDRSYVAAEPILQGTAHIAGGELVNAPMDFRGKNRITVGALQALLKALLFPEAVEPSQRFDLTADDLDFLYRAMSQLPRESGIEAYTAAPGHYHDSYVKFALFGDTTAPVPDGIRLFNKVGLAYGYLVENAYIVDYEKGIEYLLTAVISVNENGVLNDGEYAYDEIGFPFMANLGRAMHAYEATRPRARRPDLSRFAPYR